MPKGQAFYYSAPTTIRDVPGVVVKRDIDSYSDFYTGTAEALVQAGLATADMFPGQPGRCLSTGTYRPLGVERSPEHGWWRTPGYMTIHRNPSGTFRIALTVSHEEQARHEREREANAQEQALRIEVARQEARAERQALDLASSWPFRCISRERWDRLSEFEKGMVQGAMMVEIKRCEAEGEQHQQAQGASQRASRLRVVWSAPAS